MNRHLTNGSQASRCTFLQCTERSSYEMLAVSWLSPYTELLPLYLRIFKGASTLAIHSTTTSILLPAICILPLCSSQSFILPLWHRRLPSLLLRPPLHLYLLRPPPHFHLLRLPPHLYLLGRSHRYCRFLAGTPPQMGSTVSLSFIRTVPHNCPLKQSSLVSCYHLSTAQRQCMRGCTDSLSQLRQTSSLAVPEKRSILIICKLNLLGL